MPSATWTKIARQDVASGTQTNFTFSSIPQIYTDLVLIATIRNTGTGFQDAGFTLNGSPSATGVYMGGTGSGTRSGLYPGQFTVSGDNQTAGYYGSNMAYFPDYATSKEKVYWTSAFIPYTGATMYDNQDSGYFSGYTTAISSITIGGTFVQYCSATLYGIKNA